MPVHAQLRPSPGLWLRSRWLPWPETSLLFPPWCPVTIEPGASLQTFLVSDLEPLAADVGPPIDICGCTLEYDATVTHDVKPA